MKDVRESFPQAIMHQEALAAFGRRALRTDNLEALFSTACEEVARALRVPITKIAMPVPNTDELVLRALFGIPASIAESGKTRVPGGSGSAMGYTLQQGCPTISTVDEERRFYPSHVVKSSGAKSSVNVVIWQSDRAAGVLEADSLERDAFSQHDIHFLELYANLIGAALERCELTERAARVSAEREKILQESVHRLKNIFAVIHAVAGRTRKEAKSLEQFMDIFSGRLSALARVQELTLLGTGGPIQLYDLLRIELAATGAQEGKDFVAAGPEFLCTARNAQALGLLFHELTTNSCKYGALSFSAAEPIRITWEVHSSESGSAIELRWDERTPTSGNSAEGFGSEFMRVSVPRMFNGTVDLKMNPDGICCEVRFTQLYDVNQS